MRDVPFQMRPLLNGSWESWEGGLALVLAAIVYDLFLAALRRADRAFPSTDPTESTWWFGYARDAANLLGFFMFSASFAILGLPLPLALLGGAFWSMAAYGLDYLLARLLHLTHPHVVLGAILTALAVVAAIFRQSIAIGLAGLVGGLF